MVANSFEIIDFILLPIKTYPLWQMAAPSLRMNYILLWPIPFGAIGHDPGPGQGHLSHTFTSAALEGGEGLVAGGPVGQTRFALRVGGGRSRCSHLPFRSRHVVRIVRAFVSGKPRPGRAQRGRPPRPRRGGPHCAPSAPQAVVSGESHPSGESLGAVYGPRHVTTCLFDPALRLFMLSALLPVSTRHPSHESAFSVVRVRPDSRPMRRHCPSRRPVGPVTVMFESRSCPGPRSTCPGAAYWTVIAPKWCSWVADPPVSNSRRGRDVSFKSASRSESLRSRVFGPLALHRVSS